MTPTKLLRVAASKYRKIMVMAPEGGLPGYLLGIDETHLALYAQFKSEKAIDWAVLVAPRTLVTIITDQVLETEAEEVRTVYHAVGGSVFLRENATMLHLEEE